MAVVFGSEVDKVSGNRNTSLHAGIWRLSTEKCDEKVGNNVLEAML
jgi:hypothetical protein